MPVVVNVPATTPVIITEQLPIESRAQLAATVPTVVSDEVNLTEPDGTFGAVVVSVTETEQETVVPAVNDDGQDTLVDVLSSAVTVTVTVPAPLVLPL